MILDALTSDKVAVAGRIARKHLAMQPHIWERYGAIGVQKCEEDAGYHLSFLAEAWIAEDPNLFSAYARWVAVVLQSRHIPAEHLATAFSITEEILEEYAEGEESRKLQAFMRNAMAALEDASPFCTSYIVGDAPVDVLARDYLAALLRTDRARARALIFQALSDGISVRNIYLEVFERTQYEIGRLWQTNALSVAQEHYCTAATQSIMGQLYERFLVAGPRHKSMVAICVSGELHEVGLRIVCDFLEMEGWDAIYCGANTPLAGIIAMLKDQNAELLAISATMTFHISRVKDIVEAVRQAGLKTKVIVGGAAFRQSVNLWRTTGADAFAENAATVLEAVNEIVGK